jgi:hypothetical protein
MKKIKVNLLFVLTVALLFLLLGCSKNNIDEKTTYPVYPFMDTTWTRKAEHDIETIRFSSDGSFVYYCACGNPVNDSDLNEGYTYDDKTKTITVKYIETTEETVSTIKIEACDGERIRLNFDGEIREFVIGLS